ncbi:MAG: NAD(P)-dependent alcohol dehydrogenase [Candidatus Thorarchaeota archaeon]|nr:NAD(P)-dependent alcohol dehydrogenase [Candidatus Thorarchaeota archaeon]
MKAVVWTKYGPPDGLQMGEVERPQPKANEVLVKIHATTVTAGDCEMRTLTFPFGLGFFIRLYTGLRKPKRVTILGQELAGEIEEVGNDVTLFKKGDLVFGATEDFQFGTYAEYISLPEDGPLAMKPNNLTFEEAAAVPVGGLNALHFIKQGNLQSGQTLLINGAGGSIGTIAIQLAKSLGVEVTAVDSTNKLDMLRSIGADFVIDYTQVDFTKSGKKYDAIFDIVGKASYSGCMRSLMEDGVYLLGNLNLSKSLRMLWTRISSSKRIVGGSADYDTADLIFLKESIESGKLKVIIDRTFPLEQVAAAHIYVESGEKIGNVVISVNHDIGDAN